MDEAMVKSTLIAWRDRLEKRLVELTDFDKQSPYATMYEAVRYSLLNAGKRIRPALTLEFCKAAGGDTELAIDSACAIEMIHTYSLIHDDLPCMDDDDMRRGKPSCHKVFGEAVATLAGDTLQALAASTVADCKDVPADHLLRVSSELFRYSGVTGMIGGQLIDIESEGKHISVDTLRCMIVGKTCALIEAACVMGCIVAGADEAIIEIARGYGREIGIAFQIIDDILDVEGDPKLLGKPIASDAQRDKQNYVSLMGIEGARRFAQIHTDSAVKLLEPLEDKADFLRGFAYYLLGRIS